MLKRERLTEVLQNQLQDRKNETEVKNKKFAEILEKQEKRICCKLKLIKASFFCFLFNLYFLWGIIM
jgi:hypothetical protein